MKKFAILSVLFVSAFSIFAQTPELSDVMEKLQQLEETVKQHGSQIVKLTSDVNEVTKQNLALKKNLNLQPTIAVAKAGTSMEYRVMEVKGDIATKLVTVVITSNVIGADDKRIYYYGPTIIDEQGHGYDGKGVQTIEVKGVAEDILQQKYLDHHPDAPYTLDLRIKGVPTDVQYIKYLSLDVMEGSKHMDVVFQNLPIKWEVDQ